LTEHSLSDIFEPLASVRKRLSYLEKDPIMLRSVVVTLLFLILPSLALAQELDPGQQVTHEVVKGENLWSLAERYLGNPYRWPLIYEANASQIQDPNLLEPGQLLVIPGVGREVAQVQGVMVITRAEAAVAEEEIVGPPAGRRTIFYPRSFKGPVIEGRVAEAATGGVVSTAAVSAVAVPLGLVYASDWLVEGGEVKGEIGTLAGFSEVHAERTPLGPAWVGERLQIATKEGARLRVGDLLQSFRPLREEWGLGTVIRPTGILVVTAVSESGIIAMVSLAFDRIRVGDGVKLAPDHTPRPDVFPLPVESNVTATILGFPTERQVQSFGASAFLDVGEPEGISIGDIFRADVSQPGPFFGMEAARLQVVKVDGDRSTARIIGLRHAVLGSGDLLRLIQKMQ
jgi:hypothetical protein